LPTLAVGSELFQSLRATRVSFVGPHYDERFLTARIVCVIFELRLSSGEPISVRNEVSHKCPLDIVGLLDIVGSWLASKDLSPCIAPAT
jgi:hypothetical protein